MDEVFDIGELEYKEEHAPPILRAPPWIIAISCSYNACFVVAIVAI